MMCYDQECHADGFCGASDGVHGCNCIDGHVGNGLDQCEGMILLKGQKKAYRRVVLGYDV